MKTLRSFAAAVALAATSFGPAYAGDPLVVVDVDPVPVKVTFSRTSLTTFAAFVGSITNSSGHTLNHVRFEATPTVYRDGNAGLIAAPFVSGASSAGCTASAGKVTCELGQMSNGQTRPLVLVFQAPLAPTTAFSCPNTWNPDGPAVQLPWPPPPPPPPTNCDRIDLDWTYFYGEGSGDNSGAAHTDFTEGRTFTALGTPTATDVWSWVPPSTTGTTFFTGNLGIAGTLFGNVVDRTTTTVFVPGNWIFPATGTNRTAQISEDESETNLSSLLTLPGSASGTSYMEIKLRRDASTIPSGLKLRDWVITYQHTTETPFAPQLCSQSTVALPLPRSGVPCEIDGSRIQYKNNNAPTPAFIGDFEARFRAVDNGRFGTQ